MIADAESYFNHVCSLSSFDTALVGKRAILPPYCLVEIEAATWPLWMLRDREVSSLLLSRGAVPAVQVVSADITSGWPH